MTGKHICEEFQLAMFILKCQDRGEAVWFRKLVDLFGEENKAMISRTIDRLFDLCMLEGHWQKVDGEWKRTFTVDEDFEGFVRGLSNTAEKESE